VAAQRTGLALDAALQSSSHLQVPTRGAEPPPSEPPTPRVGPTHHATPIRRDKAPKSRGRPWLRGDGGGGRVCRKGDRSRTIDLPITSQMLQSAWTAPVGSCLITSADPSVQLVRGGGSGNDWMIVWMIKRLPMESDGKASPPRSGRVTTGAGTHATCCLEGMGPPSGRVCRVRFSQVRSEVESGQS
jgi:hypothetical protein